MHPLKSLAPQAASANRSPGQAPAELHDSGTYVWAWLADGALYVVGDIVAGFAFGLGRTLLGRFGLLGTLTQRVARDPGDHVGAVRHRLPDALAEDRDALRAVERAGRTALAEMRRLLAAMRNDGDEAELLPQPGPDGLDSLLGEIGRAGLPVELHLDGKPFPLLRGIDLSAYRIVQEGLTNALKHAHASDADVTVRYRPDELEIEVWDNGEGGSKSDGLGHGLVGVRERVKIYGGEMTASTAPEGGFVLTTRLPILDHEP
jgi:signal transduction histidine kinase